MDDEYICHACGINSAPDSNEVCVVCKKLRELNDTIVIKPEATDNSLNREDNVLNWDESIAFFCEKCGEETLCNSKRMDELMELTATKAKLERAVTRLKEFADYDNPNSPEKVCWPVNEYMTKARTTLAEIEGK